MILPPAIAPGLVVLDAPDDFPSASLARSNAERGAVMEEAGRPAVPSPPTSAFHRFAERS